MLSSLTEGAPKHYNIQYINDLVVINTDAKEKIENPIEWNLYDYYYTKLSKNLEKEVERHNSKR